jgi:hypothetical protein
MQFTVFYSWQTDSPEETNKKFLRDVIKVAVAMVSADGVLVDSPRFESGMEGVSGTPEVATVMFEKIDRCAIFIGDVSIVAQIPPSEEGHEPKHIPNPNVSLELGYAAARIGWGRVICVMNEAFGRRDQQPFDVRNRRYPIDYTLDPKDMSQKEKVHKYLVDLMYKAILTVQENEHRAAEDARDRLDADCIRVMQEQAGTLYFSEREYGPDTDPYAILRFKNVIARLLSLKLLRYDQQPNADGVSFSWSYHWTHLGKLVLRLLKFSDLLDMKDNAVP